jgi:L-asparaginase II
MSYLPVFELTRGGIVESTHYGAIAVVDSRGQLCASCGDPGVITYLRSSAKPLQALPFIENGGQMAYGLTSQEITLICASHSGTDEQVSILKAMQAKTGVSEDALLCGTHPLTHKPTVEAMRLRGEKLTPNRHNCSGKHTGMLAFARLSGAPGDDYTNPNHPIQQRILESFAEMCSLSPEEITIGIDGCSAPNFAVPLYNTALAIARLCDPHNAIPALSAARRSACETIVQAMISHPDLLGGPNSFDTHLISSARGKVLSKGGAEGYIVMGMLPDAQVHGSLGIGIAIKISDGDLRSRTAAAGEARGMVRPAVAIETLRQLGVLTPAMAHELADYGPSFRLENWQKLSVGEGRPCFQLQLTGCSGPQALI